MGYRYGVRYRPMRDLPTITTSVAIRLLLVALRDIMIAGKGRQPGFVDKMSRHPDFLFICCAKLPQKPCFAFSNGDCGMFAMESPAMPMSSSRAAHGAKDKRPRRSDRGGRCCGPKARVLSGLKPFAFFLNQGKRKRPTPVRCCGRFASDRYLRSNAKHLSPCPIRPPMRHPAMPRRPPRRPPLWIWRSAGRPDVAPSPRNGRPIRWRSSCG